MLAILVVFLPLLAAAIVGFFSVSNVTAMFDNSQTPKNSTTPASTAIRRRSKTSGLPASSNKGANHLSMGRADPQFWYKYEQFAPRTMCPENL